MKEFYSVVAQRVSLGQDKQLESDGCSMRLWASLFQVAYVLCVCFVEKAFMDKTQSIIAPYRKSLSWQGLN